MNMDPCESLSIVGSSLVTSIKEKENNGYGECMSEERGEKSLEG
jgi:hypothetical protein